MCLEVFINNFYPIVSKQSMGLKQVYIFYCSFLNDIIYIKLYGISANKGQTI